MDCILTLTKEEVRYLIDVLDERNYFLYRRKFMLGISSKKVIEHRRAMIELEEKILRSIYNKI